MNLQDSLEGLDQTGKGVVQDEKAGIASVGVREGIFQGGLITSDDWDGTTRDPGIPIPAFSKKVLLTVAMACGQMASPGERYGGHAWARAGRASRDWPPCLSTRRPSRHLYEY